MPIYDHLAAADDTAAAALLEADLAEAGVPLPSVKGVDPAVGPGGLEAALTGLSADEVGRDPRAAALLTDPAHGAVWMMALTDRLRDALAAAAPPERERAAAAWAVAQGLSPDRAGAWDPADFTERLADLARAAAARGHRLYCRAVL
ncbi:hypothetical protein [Nocardiopsis sp. CC223A]|uniref:hypothetical protein n=1 Tax=Nocardiopsis sp. CC223A TaxID=3044051 RepID=UPI00278BE1D9|nr:hypothetical protein [Nocardiopsis sp. CC223A]